MRVQYILTSQQIFGDCTDHSVTWRTLLSMESTDLLGALLSFGKSYNFEFSFSRTLTDE